MEKDVLLSNICYSLFILKRVKDCEDIKTGLHYAAKIFKGE